MRAGQLRKLIDQYDKMKGPSRQKQDRHEVTALREFMAEKEKLSDESIVSFLEFCGKKAIVPSSFYLWFNSLSAKIFKEWINLEAAQKAIDEKYKPLFLAALNAAKNQEETQNAINDFLSEAYKIIESLQIEDKKIWYSDTNQWVKTNSSLFHKPHRPADSFLPNPDDLLKSSHRKGYKIGDN